MSEKPILEVEGLSKDFGGVKAVHNLDFYVNRGEVSAIIGPNGAGKTTVFNLLTGIYQVSGGKIFLKGEEIQNHSPESIVKKGIARTFQNIRIFKELRVIENVLIGMHIATKYSFADLLFRTKRYKKEEESVHNQAIEILESIGMKKYIHEYAVNLPYGYQKRLEIARAMATGAEILILDEPAAGMNPQESKRLMNFIKGLIKRGLTIIIIEHDMSVVMKVSDRIYVLDQGEQIAEGSPEHILDNEKVIEAYLGKGSKKVDA